MTYITKKVDKNYKLLKNIVFLDKEKSIFKSVIFISNFGKNVTNFVTDPKTSRTREASGIR